MNAEDLKSIRNSNLITYEKVISQCEMNAKSGETESKFIEFFHIDLISELAINGFKINQIRNPFGDLISIVSW